MIRPLKRPDSPQDAETQNDTANQSDSIESKTADSLRPNIDPALNGDAPPEAAMRTLPTGVDVTGSDERILLKEASSQSRVLLHPRDVILCRARGNYVEVRTDSGTVLARTGITALEERLPDRFLRVHRSAIINSDRISELISRGHGTYRIILDDGSELRSSRSMSSDLRDLLRTYAVGRRTSEKRS